MLMHAIVDLCHKNLFNGNVYCYVCNNCTINDLNVIPIYVHVYEVLVIPLVLSMTRSFGFLPMFLFA